MVEGFKQHPGIMLKPQLSTFFVWWNLLFPVLDLAFTLCFIPGIIIALFGNYAIVGPMTLALLPMGFGMNYLMYCVGNKSFKHHHLKVRRNLPGFFIYTLAYSLIMQLSLPDRLHLRNTGNQKNLGNQMSVRTMGRWTSLVLGTLAAADVQAADNGTGATAFVADDSEGFGTLPPQPRLPARLHQPRRPHRRAGGGRPLPARTTGGAMPSRSASCTATSIRPPPTACKWKRASRARAGAACSRSTPATCKALAEKTSVEVFLNRDWVETRRALDDGVRFTFGGAALEQGLGQHVTVVGLAYYQDFSDGNHRTHGRLRLIVQPSLDLGLTLQARLRTYRSASDSTPRAYFNPARYDEAMLALGFRKRFSGNMASVTADSVGRQRVGDAERTATRLLEASWETPVKAKSSLRLRAGLTTCSAAFGGPDYSYRYAQAEWLLAF
ncbi:hypothetical protein LP420_36160 [Massilia sp. B-10]|nr:hypothetical protein LP420_36160 [Massilia sp. B-10]